MTLEQHPDVVWFREGGSLARTRVQPGPAVARPRLRAAELRELCLAAGADDVGFVELEDPAAADQRADSP